MRDAPDARLPDRGGDLLRHVRRPCPQGEHTIYVCTNISCSLRGADAIYAAMQDAAGADARFNVRGFECLGACDIAPMASVNGDYVGPLDRATTAATIVDELLDGPRRRCRTSSCASARPSAR